MNERPILWTAGEAVAATGGSSPGSWGACGVSIDSRTLAAGDLFVALEGPNFDGHSFVRDALTKGAVTAVVSRRPEGVDDEVPLLLVGDTLAALCDLGKAARRRTRGRIAAVTGSVGKTGVKEALRLVLGRQALTHASDGSLNNHWGLPLSLARLAPSAAFAVFEIGMNHTGEITPLSRLARPHVAVITTVEPVHRAHFPSVEAIADAKAEIFQGVEPDGVGVLFRDNPHFARLVQQAGACGVGRLLAFGRHPQADVRLLEEEAVGPEDGGGSRVRADVAGTVIGYRLTIPGRHWVTNSLCVLATALALGADVRAAADALAEFQAPKGRGLRSRLPLAGGDIELIDDSYNASPPSMAASFQVLGLSRPRDGGRRIAVLGDMLELGDDAASLHAGLAAPLVEHHIDLVFTAGTQMAHLHEALPAAMRTAHAADSAALAPLVAAGVRAGDVVSVKGSAGSRMHRVVDALRELSMEATGPGAAAPGSEA